jgi:tripartite-type tricarboxylate transporter receptor subunit TctC
MSPSAFSGLPLRRTASFMHSTIRYAGRALRASGSIGMMLTVSIVVASTPGWAQTASGSRPADDYPNRPIRVIVPVPAGGASDIFARALAQKVSENVGRTVVVDNRAGGNATIGLALAAKAPPDGYTVVVAPNSFAVLPALYQKLPFDVFRDFEPLTLVAALPNVLAVNVSLPAKSVKELMALAKAKPGQLSVGTGGAGGTTRLSAELFKLMAGIDIVMIPYKGGGLTLTDLMNGQLQMGFPDSLVAIPHVKSGRLRALGVTSRQRLPSLSDVPTVNEAGLPGYESVGWYGLFAPAGMPKAIRNRVHAEFVKALRTPDVVEKFASQEAVLGGNGVEEFTAYVRAEHDKWSKVVKAAGIKPE